MKSLLFVLLFSPSADMCHVFKHKSFWLRPSVEKNVCKWMPHVLRSAKKNKIDPFLLSSLITVESGWRHKSVSPVNACGLTQVIPKYTGKITKKYTCRQLKNPKVSIAVGAATLKWWIDYHKGDVSRALCGYSSGFRCKGNKPLRAGMRYSRKVLAQKNKIERMYKNQIPNSHR